MNSSPTPTPGSVMDESTDGVTLHAAFLNDILNMFAGKERDLHRLRIMCQGLDLTKPDNLVPMQVYNDMCAFVEREIGPANTRILGQRIGETAFQAMVQFGMIPPNPTPSQVVHALVQVASLMIQDPKGRGWVILQDRPGHILLRRTQSFNRTLQLGLLQGLLNRSNVPLARAAFSAEITKGAPFDEYALTWMV